MDENLKKIYQKLSRQATENGFYLIPKEFYAKLFNQIEQLRSDVNEARRSRDNWKAKYKEIKNDL
jgi:DNA replication initiation complex subunit (GINS family)